MSDQICISLAAHRGSHCEPFICQYRAGPFQAVVEKAVAILRSRLATAGSRVCSRESPSAHGDLALALKRASRGALLWPEEATDLVATADRSPSCKELVPISRLIAGWIKSPPSEPPGPESLEFLTMSQARRVLAEKPEWSGKLKGDLHMHTDWSDGSATVFEMAKAAGERGYEYIGITDHTKGLRIAHGLMSRLDAQGQEIRLVNESLRSEGLRLEVLRSAEVNLSVDGEVDIDPPALGNSISYSDRPIPHCENRRCKPRVSLRRCATQPSKFSAIRKAAFTTTERAWTLSGPAYSPKLRAWTKLSKSMAMPTGRISNLVCSKLPSARECAFL